MARSLIMVSLALAAFISALSLSLFFGASGLLRLWEERENRALNTYIGERLRALADQLFVEGRSPNSLDVASALEGFPADPDWIIVQSADDVLLYYYRREDRQLGQGRNFLRRLQDVEKWVEVRAADGKLVFKYESLVPSFNQRESNRFLLAALIVILALGSLVAAVIAVVVAYWFARPVAKHAEGLAASLEAMGRGRRDQILGGKSVIELDRIAQAAASLQSNLLKEEELRRQWAADVSHDLRTPLAALKGQLEAMADGVLPATQARLAGSQRETRRLETLVNDLALLTRLETPGFCPRFESVSTKALLEELARRFSAVALERGSKLVLNARALTLQADPALLDRAFANLIDNALRYGRPGGELRLVSSLQPDGAVRVSVQNEGLIDVDHRSRLFDRLYRGDKARDGAGSGLGLSIAKAIAEAHKAVLSVNCDEGAGVTSFDLVFPVQTLSAKAE